MGDAKGPDGTGALTGGEVSDLRERVGALAGGGRPQEIRAELADLDPAIVTRLLEALERDARLLVFRVLPGELQAEVFSRLDPPHQNRLLASFSDRDAASLLRDMHPDDRTALLEDLPSRMVQKLLNRLSPEELAVARELLGYPEESVGRLMTPRFVAVRPGWTVERALSYVRSLGGTPETVKSLFVTVDDRLRGAVPIRSLVEADGDTTLEELLPPATVTVRPAEDREEAVELMRDNDLYALPVVDAEGVLLGIVTMDDALAVARQETTEDIQHFGGAEALARPYWENSIPEIGRKRIGWLLLLFVGGSLTSAVVAAFESQLEAVFLLSIFIPMLIGTGGNAGSQSVSTVIRALAVGDVSRSDVGRVLTKELAVGLLMGLLMGAAGFLYAILFWDARPDMALVVGLTLPLIVLWANAFASTIPLAADRVGIDPTLMSAPLITTFVDATGLLIYFSIARWILGI